MMRRLRPLYRWPYSLLSVFSTDKSYRNNPILGSWLLNRLGLHVARVVISHGLYRFRLLLLSPLVPAADRRQFLRQGYIVKENFLPPAQFAALQQEINDYHGPIREIVEGDTETQRLFLTERTRQGLPACDDLVRQPALDRLLRYAGSKNRPPFFYIENTKQHAADTASRDPQKDLHMDTFHPCVKAWLYMDEVSDRNGPYVYVPGSQRLSWQRLKWEYKESLAACDDKRHGGPRYWDGSCRVSDEDLAGMGYPQPQPMRVAPNTLVLANVRGFHCRGNATEPSTRLTIWMQARDNPFNPLPTPLPRTTARLFEAVWQRILKRQDERLAAQGIRRSYNGRFERY